MGMRRRTWWYGLSEWRNNRNREDPAVEEKILDQFILRVKGGTSRETFRKCASWGIFIDNREERHNGVQKQTVQNLSVKKHQNIRKAKQAGKNLNVFLSTEKQDQTKFDWVVRYLLMPNGREPWERTWLVKLGEQMGSGAHALVLCFDGHKTFQTSVDRFSLLRSSN